MFIILPSCSIKQKSYDPYSEIRIENFAGWYKNDPVEDDLLTPERIQLNDYRYWHDMQEAEKLFSYQGIKESYRFIFWGDHKPFVLVRINHWKWNEKFTISLRTRINDDYNSSSCIFDSKQQNPEKCPPTIYKRIEDYEIPKSVWVEFKEKIRPLSFFSYKPVNDPDFSGRVVAVTGGGTSWEFDGLLNTEGNFLENNFEVNTPPKGQLYDIGEFLLKLVGEDKLLERTKF